MPQLVIGDFNEVCNQSKKLGGNPTKINCCMAFNACIYDCGLTELKSSGLHFTWTNKSMRNPIFEKLDKALVNDNWLEAQLEINIVNLPKMGSDHSPVLLKCSSSIPNENPTVKPFKFEPFWYHEPFFKTLINDNQRSISAELPNKLTSLSQIIRSWTRICFENIFHKKKRLWAWLAGVQKAFRRRSF